MGSPELPNEPENIRSIIDAPAVNFEPNSSDDSDIDDENIYDGYELIPMVESTDAPDDTDNNSEDDELTNLPNILSRVDPIERQIWNEPRPREDKLDNINAEQIMSVMVGITLPSTAVPDWAQVIPEERWKQDLLERISQRKEAAEPN